MEAKYTIIYNDILDNDDLSIQEQSILIAIKSYFNKEKGYAFPSYTQLKRRSKISDNRTLIKNINSIIKKGYIKKETVKGKGCKYYIVNVSGGLHLVENYSKCKITPTPSVKLHEVHSGELHQHPVENYTTTNTNTITNINTTTTTIIDDGGGNDFNILEYAEKRNFILSAIQIQSLLEDVEQYSLSEVQKALDIADDNGVRKYSYYKSVLERRRAGSEQKKKSDIEFEKIKRIAEETGEDPF